MKTFNEKKIIKAGFTAAAVLFLVVLLCLLLQPGLELTAQQERWTAITHDKTNFPLVGKHRTVPCADCHLKGVMQGTPTDRDPNHQQAGFPTDCVPCHGSDALTWTGATFNHDLYWRLQGAHKTLACNICHSAGYDLPRDCYGCHKKDYDATRAPNHQSAGFPTACDSCHYSSHMSWNQAVFSHQFPIFSGNHRNIPCSDCHLTANYREFSCIDCHEHGKNDMDDEHRGVSGYSYNSQACYSCHPTGGSGGD